MFWSGAHGCGLAFREGGIKELAVSKRMFSAFFFCLIGVLSLG